MRDLTAERVRELLDYDMESGAITWRKRTGGTARMGLHAGTTDNSGYTRIGIDRRIYRAHRLVWLHVHGAWPVGEIDHIDGDKSNNRLSNLRDVSRTLNQQNLRKAHKRSASKTLGVSQHAATGKWRARIWVNGKNKSLGLYSTKAEASATYVAAKRVHHEGATL